VATSPGDLVQVDTLTITLGFGEVIKHFSAWTSILDSPLAEVHTRVTAKLAAGILARFVTQAPFPIKAIWVDKNSEFMAEYEC